MQWTPHVTDDAEVLAGVHGDVPARGGLGDDDVGLSRFDSSALVKRGCGLRARFVPEGCCAIVGDHYWYACTSESGCMVLVDVVVPEA